MLHLTNERRFVLGRAINDYFINRTKKPVYIGAPALVYLFTSTPALVYFHTGTLPWFTYTQAPLPWFISIFICFCSKIYIVSAGFHELVAPMHTPYYVSLSMLKLMICTCVQD